MRGVNAVLTSSSKTPIKCTGPLMLLVMSSFPLDRFSICMLNYRLLYDDLSLKVLKDFINKSKSS